MEDLEFGIIDEFILVEYEEDNSSLCSEPGCLPEYIPIVDILDNHLHRDFSHKVSKKLNEGVGEVLNESNLLGNRWWWYGLGK